MGWLMVHKNIHVLEKGKALKIDDLKADEIVMFQHKHYYKLVIIFCFIIPTFIPYYLWNESVLNSFFVCSLFRIVFSLHMTWFVNSAAHIWGDRPFDKNITPRENWFVVFVSLGEGFHNYHHKYPNDYAASKWGSKYNVTTMFLNLCLFIGLAYDAKGMQKK